MAIDFSLSDDDRLLRDTVAEFAKKDIHESLRKFEEEGIPESTKKTAIEMGLFSVEFPPELGGAGLRMFQRVLVTEELAVGDAGIAYSLFIHLPYSYVLLDLASDEVKKEFLVPVISGDKKGCLVRAEIYDDEIITGFRAQDGKISGRGICEVDNPDYLLVFAKVGDRYGLYLTEGDKVASTRRLIRCGVHSSPSIEFMLENVPCIPICEDVLSHPEFWKPIARVRIYLSALLVGLSRIAHEYSLRYALQRVAFGQPIAKHQALSFMIADMSTLLAASRLILWQAVYEFDKEDRDIDKTKDLVKEAFLGACEVAAQVSSDAVQILGGHGYIKDHPVEKWMRDCKDISLAYGKPEGIVGTLKVLEWDWG